jgi:hypothetical protein
MCKTTLYKSLAENLASDIFHHFMDLKIHTHLRQEV